MLQETYREVRGSELQGGGGILNGVVSAGFNEELGIWIKAWGNFFFI